MQELLLSGQDFTELFKAILSKKAAVRFKAMGFSMSPFIRDKDVLTIAPSSDDSVIACGEVTAFIHPLTGKLAVHRVVSVKNGFYVIKGDNTAEADGLIPRKDILGCVIKVERKEKTVFFGIGIEKRLIALLSRKKLLMPLFFPAKIFMRFLRSIK
jgi:phage repressor protein C with HTH and peptisase S24 domain